MKSVLLLLCYFIFTVTLRGQFIKLNGDITTHDDVPVQGVMVMAFDDGTLLKSYVTDEKGQYRFNVDRVIFDVLFYKPGLHAHSYRLNNKLDKETQGIYVDVQMDDSTAETAVDLPLWLKRHHLTATFVDSVYTEEINKVPPPVQDRRSQKRVMKQALAEQKRFANFKESTVKDTTNNQNREVTKTVIGPDTYVLITNAKGHKKYFKNEKPITETTYTFETTRRYDGVLKSTRDVKKIEKYQPLQHVKESGSQRL